MPYTISHVAVVVPVTRLLARMRLLAAVVVGSMVPDFGYLMPVRPARFETHSMLALVTFCLPVGLLSYWVFQRLMKRPLMSLLPDQAYLRWEPYAAPAAWTGPWQWLLAAIGVLGGAAVHLAWDGFTHEEGRGVRMVPELADPMLEVHDHAVTGAVLLQGLSSLVGLFIVIVAIVYALRPTGRAPVGPRVLSKRERRSWVLAFAALTSGLCAGFYVLARLFGEPYHHWMGLGLVAVAFLRALFVAALLISLLMYPSLRSRR